MAIVVRVSATCVATTSARPFVASSPIRRDDAIGGCIECMIGLRGGARSYEYNPNHRDFPSLSDVDGDGFYRASFRAPFRPERPRPPPLTEVVRNYVVALRDFSPTLSYGLLSSIVVYLLWQFESSSSIARNMRNHFQCSRYNVLRKGRYHVLILSAFSHASFRHLAVNAYAYLTFGRSARHVLARRGISLWPLVVSSAILGNLAFLAFDDGHGSCIGLSGVTLSLMAFDALIHPTKELRMFVSFIPLSISAYHLYLVLLGVSMLGMLGVDIFERGSIAHSTHLGGLVCGSLFFEAFQRGWLQRAKRAYLTLRGR
jgi:membrane associated rhomboid family serine protease